MFANQHDDASKLLNVDINISAFSIFCMLNFTIRGNILLINYWKASVTIS